MGGPGMPCLYNCLPSANPLANFLATFLFLTQNALQLSVTLRG